MPEQLPCDCGKGDNCPQCCDCDDLELCLDLERVTELQETVSAEN